MKKRRKTISKSLKVAKLNEEDGQLNKLEEKRINLIKGFKPLFGKDVNTVLQLILKILKHQKV